MNENKEKGSWKTNALVISLLFPIIAGLVVLVVEKEIFDKKEDSINGSTQHTFDSPNTAGENQLNQSNKPVFKKQEIYFDQGDPLGK
ncbi:hypothetical protein [Laceyella putida]|uniref:Uncharacterized protein n=1 Tax=Laceyella putida TaxID=110101 RepID=A0ABW2RKD4_9BACL